MKIASAAATVHRVPVQVPLVSSPRTATVVVVRVESEDGLVGFGVAGPQSAQSVAELVNRELGPFVVGRDVLMAEQLAHALEQRFNARGMTGVGSSALSGLDIALWDLRGKLLGQPVWRLLGGFSRTVRAYITFGLPEYDTDQLVEAARLAVSRGYTQLKMVVGRSSDDLHRIHRVREAVGDTVGLMLDANEGLDLLQATELARQVEQFGITWFEEPVLGNEVRLLAELRQKTTIPVAAGQFEGHRFRLRDLAFGSAVDILQTNVLYVGGYSSGLKVAHMAEVLRLPVANGGGWPDHNAHLMAAVANNHGVEMHAWQWTLAETLYGEASPVRNGEYHLREVPGLGLDPRPEVLTATKL